jgi:hypothetical protein
VILFVPAQERKFGQWKFNVEVVSIGKIKDYHSIHRLPHSLGVGDWETRIVLLPEQKGPEHETPHPKRKN